MINISVSLSDELEIVNINKAIAYNIFKARRKAGKTQAELAKALCMSYQQVQKYEIGINKVSASTLFEIAKYLQFPILYFYNIENEEPLIKRESVNIIKALDSIKDKQVVKKLKMLILTLGGK
mgnify:CR=1 FL=1